MARKQSDNDTRGVGFRIGQPFNPFGLFNGIWIAEALVRAKSVSAGAKITYGRLARYAGRDGNCNPSVPTLAGEIGMSVRQTQNYLAELERKELIRRIPRISESGQTTNAYVFLWHPLFEEGVTKTASEGVNDPAPEGVKNPAPKESQIEESQFEEKNIDLDYPPTNRKKRDSRAEPGADCSSCKPYPRLREALADYMTIAEDPERVYPKDRLVVDVMDSAGGATEDEVLRCLRYLKDDRGLRPGTKNGPRGFRWFKTVVADHFHQKRNREMVYAPADVDGDHRNGSGLSQEDFDSMTEALD
jgi:hypothetical protein